MISEPITRRTAPILPSSTIRIPRLRRPRFCAHLARAASAHPSRWSDVINCNAIAASDPSVIEEKLPGDPNISTLGQS
jgi:hypothetical protein